MMLTEAMRGTWGGRDYTMAYDLVLVREDNRNKDFSAGVP